MRSSLACCRHGPPEQLSTEPSISICVAHMQKLELELIPVRADEPALQYHCSDDSRVVERPAEPSAAIEAVKQYGCVFIRFTGRPSQNINVLGSEHQNPVLKVIELLDHLASVDIPDLSDLFAE